MTRNLPSQFVPLLVLVALAGCTAAGGPLGAPAPYTDSGAALDGDALREDHESGLRDAGSFRASAVAVTDFEDHTIRVNRSAAVDFEANRSRATSRLHGRDVDDGGITVDTYTDGNTTARRFLAEGDDGRIVRYDAARAPYDDGLFAVEPVDGTRQANGDLVATAADEVDWTQRGVERHDGGWVTRYEAAGPGNVSGVVDLVVAAVSEDEAERTGLTLRSLEVSSANATLLVSPDGVVRQFSLHLAGTTDHGHAVEATVTVATSDVGSTTVAEPTWLGEATDDLDG